jgi:hypothetical protein
VSTSGPAFVEDAKVGVRLKISALWVVLLFLYAYGDIFGFFKPGQIEDIVSGEISGATSRTASCSPSRCTSRSRASWSS